MKDQRGYLLPYMVVMPILILLQIADVILTIIVLAGVSLLFNKGEPDCAAHFQNQTWKRADHLV